MIMVFDSLEANNTAADWDKAAAYILGRTTTAEKWRRHLRPRAAPARTTASSST